MQRHQSGSRKEEKRTNWRKLRITASGSWGSTMNFTSSARFLITYLTQYSTSNIRSVILVITPTNCKLFKSWKKLILPHGKIFANSFCICNYWKTQNFFLTGRHNQAHFELNGFVNNENMPYWSADNPNWQITKWLHSEWVTVVVCYFTVSHHQTPPPSRTKMDALLVLIPCNMKTCWKLFFGIEEMPSDPKMNLVSTRQGHSTHYQFNHSVFRTNIYHLIVQCAAFSFPPQSPDLTPCNFFLWGHLLANVLSTSVNINP